MVQYLHLRILKFPLIYSHIPPAVGPDERHKRMVELNVIEQCLNLFKTSGLAVEKSQLDMLLWVGIYRGV